MKYAIIIIFLPTFLFAQEFEFRQEFDTIPVEINGWHPFAPWTGGDSETSPEFCDIDADGDFDCFVGNMGYRITYFENVGTADSAQFKYITRFFGGVIIDSTYWGRLDPCFVDIDNDGDFDLFSSCHEGLVHFWRNDGSAQNPILTWITDSLQNIQGTGTSHIEFVDIDTDGDYDLFLGNSPGRIQYYENIGSAEFFDFSLITTQFQNIDVGERASPCFADIDGDGDGDLFIGNYIGRIWYYRNDSVLPNLQFTLVTNYYDSIDVVDYASPDFVDLDSDGDQDMAIGRNVLFASSPVYGDVAFYENIGTSQIPAWTLLSEEYLTLDIGSFLSSHGTDIDGDSDYDIFIGMQYCSPDYFSFYENVGSSQQASFLRITDNYQDIHVNSAIPFFVDINDDQDPDLFMGEGVIPNPPYPGLHLFENIGTQQHAVFDLVSEDLVPWNYDAQLRPALADIDADGDKDLFLIDNDAVFYFVENIGSATQPVFSTPTFNWQGIDPSGPRIICFADIDQDGDLDLFLLHGNTNWLAFYQNVGTPQNAVMQFVTPQFLGNDIELLNPGGIDYVDIDADGDGDFIFSGERGGMMFFRNVTGEPPGVMPRATVPYRGPVLTLGPNPANPSTWISFTLTAPQEATLAVYNILGAKVTTLTSGPQKPGEHTYYWNASQNASGVYIIRLEMPKYWAAEKILVVK